MPFLPPNLQCQSNEGWNKWRKKSTGNWLTRKHVENGHKTYVMKTVALTTDRVAAAIAAVVVRWAEM